MDWILFSSIMFFGSIVYYLLVKKVQTLGVNKYVYMAVNSLVPLVLFLAISLNAGDSLIMSWKGFSMVLLSSVFLNYFGSVFGYQGIQSAPNAGYSVIIQKSYALYTSIISVFLFSSELPWHKVIAILIIILFTAIIIVEKGKGKFKIGKWVWYSFGAFFLFGATTIAAKYISLWGESPSVYLFWVMTGTTIVSWIQLYINRKEVKINLDWKLVGWLFAMSLSVTFFYWGKIQSTILAPNIGYTGAINASSNAVLTVISAIMYKQELKWFKLLSVLGVVVGLVVLVW